MEQSAPSALYRGTGLGLNGDVRAGEIRTPLEAGLGSLVYLALFCCPGPRPPLAAPPEAL